MTFAIDRTTLRRVIKALRDTLAPLWPELRRLNSVGVHGDSRPSRAMRCSAFRAALSEKYRDWSPCC